MKVFVIFACMVAGCACLDLLCAKDSEKNLNSNNNGKKAPSLADNGIIHEDHYDFAASDQSAVTNSNKVKASDKPRAAVTTTTMTSDVKRSRQSVYLGRRVIDIWSIFKHSHPHISARKYSMEGRRRFPGTLAAIRDTDKDFAIHKSGSSKTKRGTLEIIHWTEEQRRHFETCLRQDWVESFLKDRDFPDLKELALESLKKEAKLVGSLAKSGTVSTDVLNEYKAAKTAERKYVRQILHTRVMTEFPGTAKNRILCYELLNSVPQRCDDYELHGKWGTFLDKPSPARDRYKAMKAKEDATFRSYFETREGPDIYEEQTENEFEGLPPAEPDFECPKKKRESGSVAPKMHPQVFVILICVVIGILIPGLQGLGIDEDDPKANKIARKVKRIVPIAERIAGVEN